MSAGGRWRRPRRHILDYVGDIPKSKALYLQHLKFQWNYYSEIAFQRAQIYPELQKALIEQATGDFAFEKWQRAVKYRYALQPLNARGSLSEAGGRFNAGEIDTARFTAFPALYVAQDKQTAEDELLSRDVKGALFSPEELALARASSITVVSLSGRLEMVWICGEMVF
jgi:hypothetical protein